MSIPTTAIPSKRVLVCGQEEGEPEKTDDGAALYDMDENSAEESDFAGESETAADRNPKKKPPNPKRTLRSTRAIPSTTTPPSAMARC